MAQTSAPASGSHARHGFSSHSLLHRVALGAAASAMSAALIAASVTSIFAAYLTRRAHDQRVQDAAQVLAAELDDELHTLGSLTAVVADELRETRHTGVAFAIFDRSTRELLAGDPRVPASFDTECTHSPSLRACGVPARGLWVVAAADRADLWFLFALSSALAALLAGLGAWLASRPIARWLMGPLSELRQQVGAIDFATTYSPQSLGPPAGVTEVDDLRGAITELLGRVERALRQAERFAADAAHELRTPLTAVRGELELLSEESSLGPNVQVSLARAQRRVIELGTLLERLLVLALPDESQWSASELLSLQELAEDLISLLPEAERARIQLVEARGDVVVRGDTALLGLLFSNGLSNALKFGNHVSVSTFEERAEAVLRVDDDGPGIPVEQRTLAFEPFVRLAPQVRPPVPGHGLGLALIAHVAHRHGGQARFIDGAPGAHLEIRLPRQKA